MTAAAYAHRPRPNALATAGPAPDGVNKASVQGAEPPVRLGCGPWAAGCGLRWRGM